MKPLIMCSQRLDGIHGCLGPFYRTQSNPCHLQGQAFVRPLFTTQSRSKKCYDNLQINTDKIIVSADPFQTNSQRKFLSLYK